MAKRVLHIDMDAFFASIESRDLPILKGKPVIVGSLPGNRGVVSTCSYESRECGVKSGMPVSEAVKKCPEGIFLPTDGRKYMYASMILMKILLNYSPRVEPVSIDEAYVDITGTTKLYESENHLASCIKKDIKNELNLTCSIGIASTKVFAKMASDMEKPDGLVIFPEEKEKKIVGEKEVSELWGIGEKTRKSLNHLGIYKIKDIIKIPDNVLKKYFGIYGKRLKEIALGKEKTEIPYFDDREDKKSVGNEVTLGKDTNQCQLLQDTLHKLSQKVCERLRNANFVCKTISLKIRYSDFETHTIQKTLSSFTDDGHKVFSISQELFSKIFRKNKKVRLLGISVSNLAKIENIFYQTDIFGEIENSRKIFDQISKLKDKFGKRIINYGL